jgi:small subunit ribosomal protein S7
MSRKKKVMSYVKYSTKRKNLSEILITTLLKRGKKRLARRILQRALATVEKKTKREGMRVLEQAIRNLTPIVEVKSRRMGGTVYQVPRYVTNRRSLALAVRWLVFSARARSSQEMHKRLAREILDASQRRGTAFRKRDEVHRVAENNKAFAHLKI